MEAYSGSGTGGQAVADHPGDGSPQGRYLITDVRTHQPGFDTAATHIRYEEADPVLGAEYGCRCSLGRG